VRSRSVGACRSEGLAAGEHVPDGLRQTPCDVDLGDLRAALLAESPLVSHIALTVDGVPTSRRGGLHQRPAQVLRAGVAESATAVLSPGLVDPRTQTRIAAEFWGLLAIWG